MSASKQQLQEIGRRAQQRGSFPGQLPLFEIATGMRVLVTGGRYYSDAEAVRAVLDGLPPDAVLVHGAAPGADSLAARLWQASGGATEAHPADWFAACRSTCAPGHRKLKQGRSYCPAAGPMRNQRMVDAGADLVLVFPGGLGTKDCLRRAAAAGIDIEIVQ